MVIHFEEDEEIVFHVNMTTTDYTGQKIEGWTILSKHPRGVYAYNVRCQCGKEYVRNINSMVQGRSSKCLHCSKKTRMMWIPARLKV